MKLVRFKNIAAVIGLVWHALPADQSERSAVKATLEQNKGVKAGVVVKYGGVTLLGLGPPNAKLIGGPSAAAWLSLANQKAMDQGGSSGLPTTGSGSTNDWIVVENLGDGSFWLAIIRDGVPLPGTDIIYDRETTLELIREAVETAPFIVFSPDEGIRGDVPAGTYIDSKGFAELVQGIKPGKAAMRAISGVSVKMLGAIALVLVLGLAWFAYSWYAAKKEQERLVAQAAAQASAQQKQMSIDKTVYAAAVQKAIIAALEKGEVDLNQSISAPSANDAISTWVGMIADVSINQNGWSLTGFACGFIEDGSPACTVNLQRQEFGINRILLEDHPDATLEGDAATFVISSDAPQKRDVKFQDLERSNSFNLEFISDLQMLHFAAVSYTIGQSKDVVSAITLPPVPASIFKPGDTKQAAPAPAPVKMGVSNGDLTFSGSELWQLEGLREFLRRENVAVKTVDVAVSDGGPGQWTLKAVYFIKTAPEPILPIVLDPDQKPIQANLPDRFKASPEELTSWSPGSAVAASASPAPAPGAENGVAPPSPDAPPPAEPTSSAPAAPPVSPP